VWLTHGAVVEAVGSVEPDWQLAQKITRATHHTAIIGWRIAVTADPT
jgi:hypothetical protein